MGEVPTKVPPHTEAQKRAKIIRKINDFGGVRWAGTDGLGGQGILDPPKAPKSKKITKTLKLLVNSRKHD